MTKEEIDYLAMPTNYKKRKTVMDDYLNIIYKMLRDNINPAIIFTYVLSKGYTGSKKTLENYIVLLNKNNFGKILYMNWQYTYDYPSDVTIISRKQLLVYITTMDPKKEKSILITSYIDIIKLQYPILGELETMFKEFHQMMMGKEETSLEPYIEKYTESRIDSFVQSIKKDITSVKNAISFQESSGFVEGNNNKFKLIKRILYGRSNLVNLFKKSNLAFKMCPDLDIYSLVKWLPN